MILFGIFPERLARGKLEKLDLQDGNKKNRIKKNKNCINYQSVQVYKIKQWQ